jgi:hypothetical protein
MAWLIILQAASIPAVTVSLQMRFDGFRAGGCGARLKAIVPCAVIGTVWTQACGAPATSRSLPQIFSSYVSSKHGHLFILRILSKPPKMSGRLEE